MNSIPSKSRKLFIHSRPVLWTQFSADGALVFTAGQDSKVNVICAFTGEVLLTLGPYQEINNYGAAIKSLSVTSDSKYIAVGLNSPSFCINDISDYRTNPKPKQLCEQKVDARGVRVVQFTKDSQFIYVCTSLDSDHGENQDQKYSTLLKYKFPEMTLLATKKFYCDFRCSALTDDDQQLWLGSDKSIFAIDTKSDELNTLYDEELEGGVQDLFCYRSMFICCPITNSRQVVFFNTRTLQEIYSITVHNRVNTAAPHPKLNIMCIGGGLDPKLVTTSLEGNNVLLQYYDMVGKQIIYQQNIHTGPTHCIRWSDDGLRLVSASEDGSVAITYFGEELYKYQWDATWVHE